MTDLIIKGAGGIKDGLYVIKDGELFKYKSKGGTVRAYPIADRPRGEWIKKPFGYGECSECGCIVGNRFASNFCPNCGSDNRGRSE